MPAPESVERRLEFGLIRQADKIRIVLAFFLMVVFLAAGESVILRPDLAGSAILLATIGSIWSFFFLRWDELLLRGRLPSAVALVILFDLAWLTMFIIATGGFYSPFWALLLLVVVFAAMFFSGTSAAMPLTAFVVALIFVAMAGTLPRLTPTVVWAIAGRLLAVLLLAWFSWALCMVLERERRASQRLVRHLTEGVLLINYDGAVLLANPQMAQFCGMSMDELVGYRIFSPGTRVGDAVLRRMVSDVESRPRLPVSRDLTIEGRQITDLRCTVVPCGRLRGQVLGWVLIVQDVTDIRAATRLREMGLDMVSHELRSPLASLRVMAQVLNGVAGELTDAERERVAVTIERETDRLSRLVADLMDISQVERADYTLAVTAVSVPEAVGQVHELYARHAEQQGKTLINEVPAELPEVLADMDRLVQIINNLVDNAIKYTSVGGSIWLRGEALEDKLSVSVQDTGAGISPEALGVIFEKFGQAPAEGSLSASARGLGLGLYLARTLAWKMHGDLTVHSRPGEGTTFTLTLPRADARPPVVTPPS